MSWCKDAGEIKTKSHTKKKKHSTNIFLMHSNTHAYLVVVAVRRALPAEPLFFYSTVALLCTPLLRYVFHYCNFKYSQLLRAKHGVAPLITSNSWFGMQCRSTGAPRCFVQDNSEATAFLVEYLSWFDQFWTTSGYRLCNFSMSCTRWLYFHRLEILCSV